MNITAKLNNYRQSPRKVRLMVDLIRGKNADDAVTVLNMTIKRAANPIASLIKSAIANAKANFNLPSSDLFVKSLTVDNGAILYRRMPRARGVAYPIRKRVSQVNLVLGVKVEADNKKISAPKVSKEKAKK